MWLWSPDDCFLSCQALHEEPLPPPNHTKQVSFSWLSSTQEMVLSLSIVIHIWYLHYDQLQFLTLTSETYTLLILILSLSLSLSLSLQVFAGVIYKMKFKICVFQQYLIFNLFVFDNTIIFWNNTDSACSVQFKYIKHGCSASIPLALR